MDPSHSFICSRPNQNQARPFQHRPVRQVSDRATKSSHPDLRCAPFRRLNASCRNRAAWNDAAWTTGPGSGNPPVQPDRAVRAIVVPGEKTRDGTMTHTQIGNAVVLGTGHVATESCNLTLLVLTPQHPGGPCRYLIQQEPTRENHHAQPSQARNTCGPHHDRNSVGSRPVSGVG